jgi:hypothetical protein
MSSEIRFLEKVLHAPLENAFRRQVLLEPIIPLHFSKKYNFQKLNTLYNLNYDIGNCRYVLEIPLKFHYFIEIIGIEKRYDIYLLQTTSPKLKLNVIKKVFHKQQNKEELFQHWVWLNSIYIKTTPQKSLIPGVILYPKYTIMMRFSAQDGIRIVEWDIPIHIIVTNQLLQTQEYSY